MPLLPTRITTTLLLTTSHIILRRDVQVITIHAIMTNESFHLCCLGLLKASVEDYIAELKQRVENLVVKERGLEQSMKEANDERIMHQREVGVVVATF